MPFNEKWNSIVPPLIFPLVYNAGQTATCICQVDCQLPGNGNGIQVVGINNVGNLDKSIFAIYVDGLKVYTVYCYSASIIPTIYGIGSPTNIYSGQNVNLTILPTGQPFGQIGVTLIPQRIPNGS